MTSTTSKDRFGRTAVTHKGKGSKIDAMPHRHAKSVITGGDVFDRHAGHYGKKPKAPQGGPFSS